MRACLTFFGILTAAWLLYMYSQTKIVLPQDHASSEAISNINKLVKSINEPKRMISFCVYCDGATVPKGLKDNIAKFLQSSSSDIVSYSEFESRKVTQDEAEYTIKTYVWISVSVRESVGITQAVSLINSIDGVQSCKLR